MSKTRPLAIVADLLKSTSQLNREAAALIVELMSRAEETEPELKAAKYELDWLLKHVRQDPVMVTKEANPSSSDQRVVEWRRVVDGKAAGYVAVMCPRLESLFKGELPHLRELLRDG